MFFRYGVQLPVVERPSLSGARRWLPVEEEHRSWRLWCHGDSAAADLLPARPSAMALALDVVAVVAAASVRGVPVSWRGGSWAFEMAHIRNAWQPCMLPFPEKKW